MPRCEKTGLKGFRPGPTQTRPYDHPRWLEAYLILLHLSVFVILERDWKPQFICKVNILKLNFSSQIKISLHNFSTKQVFGTFTVDIFSVLLISSHGTGCNIG